MSFLFIAKVIFVFFFLLTSWRKSLNDSPVCSGNFVRYFRALFFGVLLLAKSRRNFLDYRALERLADTNPSRNSDAEHQTRHLEHHSVASTALKITPTSPPMAPKNLCWKTLYEFSLSNCWLKKLLKLFLVR